MIFSLLKKLFYEPNRHARKLRFITLGSDCILLRSARFDFRNGSNSFTGKIKIGARSMIANSFVFESDLGNVTIGSGTFINGGSRLICRDSISIGSQVTIAWGCTIYDHNAHSLDWRHRAEDIAQQHRDVSHGRGLTHGKNWDNVKSRGIVIDDKAWLGFGVTVLNGVHIGEGAIVGACSVVRNDVLPWTIVSGNPAIYIKDLRKT